MSQRVVNAAQTANKTNTAQTANKTTAVQTASKTNTAQTANKSNATQTAAKTGQMTTTSPYGGMNYDTYLKSQGKDTGYTPTVTKYAPDGTAYQSSAPTYTGSTQKYAPDGTAYTVSSGNTATNAASGNDGTSKSVTPSLDLLVGDPRDLPSGQPLNPYHVGIKDNGTDDNNGFPQTPTSGGAVPGSGSYSSVGSVAPYEAAKLQAATSQADYINALYDANEQKQRAALETAYDANVATLDRQAATIAPQFQQAANAAAAQSAVAQAAFNERAAAAGMNTGAGSQAALAQNNALQSNISSIRQAESEALAEVEAQRASLAQQYQKAIAEAVANNDAARAQALYAEAVRVDESLVSTAANQAAENFNEWQAMYKLAKG